MYYEVYNQPFLKILIIRHIIFDTFCSTKNLIQNTIAISEIFYFVL